MSVAAKQWSVGSFFQSGSVLAFDAIMTVSYSAEVATATFGTFGRLLFRWKASVYKLVWRETFIFAFFYIAIAIIYRVALTCEQQRQFDGWAKFCSESSTIIPLTFVMGFYVNLVIDRWWAIYRCVAWPDRACYYVSMCLPLEDPQSVQYRRAIVRYLNLAQLLVLRSVSTSVKTRFPTLDQVVSDGFMTPEERHIFDSMKGENQLEKHNKYWIVLQWASNVICRAYDRHLIRDQYVFKRTFEEIVAFRDKLGLMLSYDWVSVPLSYTQVVTMVVYAYFITALIGRQYIYDRKCCPGVVSSKLNCSDILERANLDPEPNQSIQQYTPIFPLLEFVFYMGWLKVAESIMNPLGQDDDDFEINYLINRNLAVSYAIVDSYKESCPQVKKETEPVPAVSKLKAKSYRGSAVEFDPPENPDGTRKVRRRRRRRIFDSLRAQESGAVPVADTDENSPRSGTVSPTSQLKSKSISIAAEVSKKTDTLSSHPSSWSKTLHPKQNKE